MQSIRGARRRERSRRASAIAGSLARARRYATEVRPEPEKQRRKIDGQALAEFALILPVFLFLLLMAVDFGRVFFTYIQLNNAAREAAAYAAGQVGSETYDPVNVLAYAQQETNTQGQKGTDGVVVQVSCETPDGTALDCTSPDVQGAGGIGNTVTVSVHQDFSFLTPLIGDVFGAPLTMTATSTAAINGQISGKGTAPGTCTTAPISVIKDPPDVAGDPLTLWLDATASTPISGPCQITGYTWEISDGTVIQDPSDIRVQYQFPAPGIYTVTLTTTNPFGTDPRSISVTVGSGATPSPSPTPAPTPQPTPSVVNTNPTCNTMPGFTYQFTGNGTGQNAHRMTFYGSYTGQPAPASWSWSFGDSGSVGSGVTASNKYKAAGTYTVTLTVKNGTCSNSVSQTVVVP